MFVLDGRKRMKTYWRIWGSWKSKMCIYTYTGMDQYLYIPFLVGWTSIYQLFWGSPGVQGFDPSPYNPIHIYIYMFLLYFIVCSHMNRSNLTISTEKTWRSHHDISADAVFFYPRLGAQGQSSQTQQRHLRRLRSPALRLHQGAGRSWAFIMMFHSINRCVEYITIFIIEMNIISMI